LHPAIHTLGDALNRLPVAHLLRALLLKQQLVEEASHSRPSGRGNTVLLTPVSLSNPIA
jgi:hypothetical protein